MAQIQLEILGEIFVAGPRLQGHVCVNVWDGIGFGILDASGAGNISHHSMLQMLKTINRRIRIIQPPGMQNYCRA